METTLLLGDCLDRLRELPDSSVHACVTDPPYGLSFMGKRWDVDVPGVEVWREVLRVLKPGGHLLAFFGTRTYHRGVVAVEDAGFEIRDQIGWAFGSGFPKSHDVSKAIDAALGAEREVVGPSSRHGGGIKGAGSSYELPPEPHMLTAPATPEAQAWQGWGTALKPAWEPIVVARKPLDGTVAANVLEHGTGGINVDGCRVGTGCDKGMWPITARRSERSAMAGPLSCSETNTDLGRWPANLIHDGSDEVVGLFPESLARPVKPENIKISGSGEKRGIFKNGSVVQSAYYDAETSAARFFYCAKASKRDREEGLEDAEPVRSSDRVRDDLPGGDNPRNRSNHARVNHHPTVKPTDLMRYLCRLVTPSGGVVLDPFMGSGSTGKAAILEGFSFIGIEREAEYLAIAEARIRHVTPEPPQQAAAPAPLGQLTLW